MTLFSTYLSLFSTPLVDPSQTTSSSTPTSDHSPTRSKKGGVAAAASAATGGGHHRASVDVSEPVELHALSSSGRQARPGVFQRARSSLQAIPQYFTRNPSSAQTPTLANGAGTVAVQPPAAVAQSGMAVQGGGYPHVQSVGSEEGVPLPGTGSGTGQGR